MTDNPTPARPHDDGAGRDPNILLSEARMYMGQAEVAHYRYDDRARYAAAMKAALRYRDLDALLTLSEIDLPDDWKKENTGDGTTPDAAAGSDPGPVSGGA